MTAAVTSTGGFPDCPRFWTGPVPPTNCVSYTWIARLAGSSTWHPLPSTKNVTWSPQTVLGLSLCHSYTAEARLCAEDPNGRTCKNTFFTLVFPSC